MTLIYYVGFSLALLALIGLSKVYLDDCGKWDKWAYVPFLILWIFTTSICINCFLQIESQSIKP